MSKHAFLTDEDAEAAKIDLHLYGVTWQRIWIDDDGAFNVERIAPERITLAPDGAKDGVEAA